MPLRVGGAAPRGQSLLRSCLAARSFPPRPPAYVLAAPPRGRPPMGVSQYLSDRNGVTLRHVVRRAVGAATSGALTDSRPPDTQRPENLWVISLLVFPFKPPRAA